MRGRRTKERLFRLDITTDYSSQIHSAHGENQCELTRPLFEQRLNKSQPQDAILEVAQCSETPGHDKLQGHIPARGYCLLHTPVPSTTATRESIVCPFRQGSAVLVFAASDCLITSRTVCAPRDCVFNTAKLHQAANVTPDVTSEVAASGQVTKGYEPLSVRLFQRRPTPNSRCVFSTHVTLAIL